MARQLNLIYINININAEMYVVSEIFTLKSRLCHQRLIVALVDEQDRELRELIHMLDFHLQKARNTFSRSGRSYAGFFFSEAGFSKSRIKSQNTWRRKSTERRWLGLKLELLILYEVQTDP